MNIKQSFLLSSLALSMTLVPLVAKADHRDHDRRHSHYNSQHASQHASQHGSVRARVIRMSPVFETYSEPEYRRTCYSQESRYDADNSRRNAVIGGVIGGLVGYQVGDKARHKKIGAVAGALIGATIGKNASKKRVCETDYSPRHSSSRYSSSREEATRYGDHQGVVGYDVVYKYRGRHYTTFTQYNPGRWINVQLPRYQYHH